MIENPVFLVCLFGVGLAAICVELFIPGVIVGLFGLGCVVGSIVMSYSSGSHVLGHVLLGCGLAFIPVFFLLWLHVLSRVFALKSSQKATAAPDGQHEFLGKEGVTLTTLRPSGAARIDGTRVDVVARGVIIEPNVHIRVVAVEGNRVVVEAVEA